MAIRATFVHGTLVSALDEHYADTRLLWLNTNTGHMTARARTFGVLIGIISGRGQEKESVSSF